MKATYDLAVKWFDALKGRRFEEMYSYMDENIQWENSKLTYGYNDIIPWIGTYHGKYEVIKTFEAYGSLSETEHFDLIDIFVDGNIILAHVYETNRVIDTGTIYHADVFFQMKRDGDKITEWQAFWDTTEAVAAFKKKQLP
ncbi:MAG TPA: hypothetical protein DCZ23_08510 [Lachnospiraceae bacterium]|nr:hypothetical protein [Lachnospiraceae bacterium]